MTSAHQPSAYSHGEPLVGRDRELGTLRAHLDAALVGRGSLVLVGGAAGIGKTTLAEALCAEATARGASLLVGRCYDLTETPPYGPWAEVLARTPRHGDDLPDPPDLAGRSGATSEAAIFAAVRDHLIALAARQPLVLLLEDLHWADPASLDLLRALARGLADATLLLLATYRAEEVRRQHRLYALLPTLVREARADRLDLRPLGDDDLRALVRARHALTPWDEARLVAYLGERSGGNPLFAGELLRALAAGGALRPAPADGEGTRWTLGGLAAVPVPALLRQVIDARVARLGEGAYRLLGLAATIGQEVPLALWRVAGAGDDEMLVDVVGRAVAAGVLAEVPDSGGVRFVHALIREALYEGVPLPRRQAWHRRIGEALLTAPAPDPDAVADHFRRAGDARAYDWLVLAGHRAYRASARSTASDRYEAALESAERLGTPPGERAWLLFRLSGTTWFAPTSSRARSAIDVAAALAEEAGERALLACARWWRGFLECHRGRLAIGVAGMAAGVADLEALAPADAAVLRARMEAGYLTAPFEPRGWLVEWLAFTGYYARAVTLGAQVLAGAPVDRAGQDYALAYKGMPPSPRPTVPTAPISVMPTTPRPWGTSWLSRRCPMPPTGRVRVGRWRRMRRRRCGVWRRRRPTWTSRPYAPCPCSSSPGTGMTWCERQSGWCRCWCRVAAPSGRCWAGWRVRAATRRGRWPTSGSPCPTAGRPRQATPAVTRRSRCCSWRRRWRWTRATRPRRAPG